MHNTRSDTQSHTTHREQKRRKETNENHPSTRNTISNPTQKITLILNECQCLEYAIYSILVYTTFGILSLYCLNFHTKLHFIPNYKSIPQAQKTKTHLTKINIFCLFISSFDTATQGNWTKDLSTLNIDVCIDANRQIGNIWTESVYVCILRNNIENRYLTGG